MSQEGKRSRSPSPLDDAEGQDPKRLAVDALQKVQDQLDQLKNARRI